MIKGLIGAEALIDTLNGLKDIDKALVKDTREQARELAARVEAEAPRGPTGNLKRSVEYGTFKKRPGKPTMSFVRISQKKAPHAHLVEFGARGGQMPANPFFRRATSGDAPLERLADAAAQAVDDVLK